MLALSRKKGEAIIVNNNVEITILEVKGDQVKIGISAPKDVPIYRKEVYMQIQQANEEAANAEGLAALADLLG
ncbi:MAG: carbon storage regulator CsrA [Lachnospiraceae bacterium]|nr:carbon storage regulator CsrA [Lachnospiraceae bacterium]